MDRKKEIRAKILKMRQALPKEEVREKSLRIMRRIEETETFKNADNLLAYIDSVSYTHLTLPTNSRV